MHHAGRPVPSARSSLFVVLVAALVLGGVSGCGVAESANSVTGDTSAARHDPAATPASPSGPLAPEVTPEPGPAVTSVVVVGDSITAGAGAADRAESPGRQSWLPGAQGAPLDFRGGWAVPGATTSDMLGNVMAHDADVLVVMGGTNDLTRGLDWSVSRANLLAIVGTVAADRVVLSAIPPLDAQPAAVLAYNGNAAWLAAQQGWEFTDPWTSVSQGGAFVPGASPDGVHPTEEVAGQAGANLRGVLLDGAGG